MQRLLDAAQEAERRQQARDEEEESRKQLQQQLAAQILADELKGDIHDPETRRIIREVYHMDPREYGHPERGMGRMILRGSKYDGLPQLQAMEEGVLMRGRAEGKEGIDLAVDLFRAFEGQSESGPDNHGAIVRLMTGGREGLPWCGATVEHIGEKTMPGVWKPKNPLLASSYVDDARDHGSLRGRQGYMPRKGDYVFLDHHIGMVVDVSANGEVTYMSGNYADGVRPAVLDMNKPLPGGVIGFGDTHAQAAAKGKSASLHGPAQSIKKAEVVPSTEQAAILEQSSMLSGLKLDLTNLNLAYSHIPGAPSDVPAQNVTVAAKPVAERTPA